MPKNEEGEFELILGNRQLLSVFFIVVVLLGVFFTMGYIVGRNSAPPVSADATPVRKEGKPMVVDSPTPTPVAETPTPAESSAPKETAPQQPAPAPRATPTPRPAKAEAPRPTPVPASAAAAASDAPASGQTYLQLAATSRHEADIEVDVLRKKGFKAMAAEIPEKAGTFRVLVGPIPDGGVNKTKSDLNAAGFPGDRAIRRTF
jgi:cell division septation protein DedD